MVSFNKIKGLEDFFEQQAEEQTELWCHLQAETQHHIITAARSHRNLLNTSSVI